jgi:hypothetical protein
MADVYNELRELIAAECHSQWTGWMDYLFSKTNTCLSAEDTDQGELIPQALVLRWRRQCLTPYEQLPEKEKESDRVEADKIVALLNQKGYIGIPKPPEVKP